MCDTSCLASNSAKVFFSIETCSQWCWPVTNICILYFKIDLYMYYILLRILENTDIFLCSIYLLCVYFWYFHTLCIYLYVFMFVIYILDLFTWYVFHIIMHAWVLRCIFSRSSFHIALSFFPMAMSLYKHKTCTKKNTKTYKDNSFKICTMMQFRLLVIDSL